MAGIKQPESKPLALIDSNVLVYALVTNYPTTQLHEKCVALLEKGLNGELDYILALNPIIVVEVFSAVRKILSCDEAESRVGSLLRLRRLAFLTISKEACQSSIEWAKEKNIPVNDALIACSAIQHAELIYTMDEEHFRRLEDRGIKMLNPTSQTFKL
ncbi:MAG: PIN domain-containing protein [Candidatus Bathyarchaeia archaeon]|jgi:predicted nucleic acid-binding protein